MKLSTLGYYLVRWGFSVQRPVKRAYKQDQKQIDKWLNDELPGITKRANDESAEIFFGNETNIQNTANYMKGYAPKGKTPVVKVGTDIEVLPRSISKGFGALYFIRFIR